MKTNESPFERVIQRAKEVISDKLNYPLDAGLYIVATPIGNLADITLRALAVLARADCIFCEDTRHTRILLAHFSIKADLKAYHEHSRERDRSQILKLVGSGKSVALVSDAGTPLISDPGFKLVREARDLGLPIYVVPGPSAVTAALPLSGLPTDRFFFEGFLPVKEGQRKKRLDALRSMQATLIFYETAKRLTKTLQDMSESLGPREVVVAKELTKLYENVLQGSFVDLMHEVSSAPPRGEFVIIVAPPEDQDVSDEDIMKAVTTALAESSFRDAVQSVSESLSVSKKRVYELGLAVKDGKLSATE